MPDTTHEDAMALAEHCRAAIAAVGIVHTEAHPLSMSFGMGTHDGRDGADLREFVAGIDPKLYAAKDGGRDAIVA